MSTQKPSEKEADNIHLRSEAFKDILGRPPRWMVRWGITVIFVLIAMLIAGSWFFKYPDVVPSKIVVTTQNPPAPIVVRSSGKIDHMLVQDKQQVDKGQALAIIENTADYRDVLELEDRLTDLDEHTMNPNPALTPLKAHYRLGEVQPQYAIFLKKLEELNHFIRLDYHQQKINSLKDELTRSKQYYQQLLNQKSIIQEEYELIKRQLQRDSILYEKEVIPEAEYEKSESQLLNKKYALEQIEISLSNSRIQLSRIEQNMLELELQYKRQKNQLKLNLAENLDNLKAAIKEWKRKYYLSSPTDGKVTFTSYWSANQYVESGKRVMTVLPQTAGEIIGKMTLPFRGAGKVKEGQKVNIQFTNYPVLEYGMVKGVVRSISLVPEDQAYSVEVGLPEGLTTFYGIELQFSQQMQGKAEVITKDIRLLERIVRPLRYVVNKNLKP